MKRIWDRFSRLRWVVALLAALVGAAGGLLYMTIKEYNDSATATVYVTPPISANAGDALVADQYAANRTQLYVTLIKSPELAKVVIDRLKLSESPEALAERVDARATPLTSLLSITAKGVSPSDARNLVTAYADSLSDFAKTVEGSGGLRGAPSVVAVAYPVAKDQGLLSRYDVVLVAAVGVGLLGFLYSTWYRRRYPNVQTPEQVRSKLHIALVEVVDIRNPDMNMRRLQAELFSPRHNDGWLMIVGGKVADQAAMFGEMLANSLEAAGRDVQRVGPRAGYRSDRGTGPSEGLVIIDVPALLESSTSAAALHDSDHAQAVLVTRYNITSLRDMKEVQDLLAMNNIAIRGAVILRSRRLRRTRSAPPVARVTAADNQEAPWPTVDVLEAEKRGRTVRAD